MALIKCPECNNMISDKSKQCIHCGFPLPTVEKEIPDGFCLIDGVPRDLREALNKIDDYPNMTPDEQKKLKGWIFGQCQTISIYAAEQLLNIILETHAVPKEFDTILFTNIIHGCFAVASSLFLRIMPIPHLFLACPVEAVTF